MTPDRGASLEIRLELDLDSQPIHGRLWPPAGAPSTFIGWLGLTAALQDLRRVDEHEETRDQT